MRDLQAHLCFRLTVAPHLWAQPNSARDHFTLLLSSMTELSAKIIRRIPRFPNDPSLQAVLKRTSEMRD